ncbi:hypothetical protein TU75_12940 [Pseudomonas poae]|nr:hypothetical protein TU75_12940 [Pseudomonas poae]
MACGNSSIAKNEIAGRAYREGAPAELFDVPLPSDLIGEEPGCYGRLPPVVSGKAPWVAVMLVQKWYAVFRAAL